MREIHYDEARVPRYTLPDALRFADGSRVDGAAGWRRRRAEILDLFASHVYGRTPAAASSPVSWETVEEGGAPDGVARRRQVRITFAGAGGVLGLDLLLYVPAGAGPSRPVPVFLGLNFGGNHTVDADPAIRLPTSWVGGPGAGEAHRATEEGRGRAAGAWPVRALLARGYGLATMYCGDAEPDHAEGFAAGIRGLVAPDSAPAPADAWGALGAWAWALSRGVDALQAQPEVDAARIAGMGVSRLGKAALWAGAQDERFALVISACSGCGGAALSRREFGETVARINAAFPHWFCPAFRRYNDREADLPVDQHMLLALVAPRPVYVASAEEDRWADPRGEFLAALGADPVYRLLGTDGLGAAEMPPVERPVRTTIGHHIRRGGHGITAYDWDRFMDFGDRHLGQPAGGR